MVSLGRLSFSAISEIVIPVITLIIGNIQLFLIYVHYKEHLLNKCEVENAKICKKSSLKRIFSIDKMFVITDIYRVS
jgi:hypothetical protein